MNREASLTRKDLAIPFVRQGTVTQKIGIEVELAVVDPTTGVSVPYGGARGVASLLKNLMDTDTSRWKPIFENGNILGLKGIDGETVTLEMAGAVEYSSQPSESLFSIIEKTNHLLHGIAEVTKSLGWSLLSNGNMPFDKPEDAKWIPKVRSRIMRDYYSTLGESAALSWRVMAQTLSTQVNLDYLSEEDMCKKLRVLMSAAPVFTALFANSPIKEGSVNGVLSNRAQYWLKFDPSRSGCIPPALDSSITFNNFIDWALEVPMVFRLKDGIAQSAHGHSFSQLLKNGFDDGSLPTLEDWSTHLSGIFTDVRFRKLLEVRSIDCPAFSNIASVPAFIVGLIYHAPSLNAAWNILRNRTLDDYEKARSEVCIKGLKARYGRDSIGEIATELVRLAREGLKVRVQNNIEPSFVLDYLAPLERVVSSGRTFAENLIEEWNTDFQQSPALFIKAYEVQ